MFLCRSSLLLKTYSSDVRLFIHDGSFWWQENLWVSLGVYQKRIYIKIYKETMVSFTLKLFAALNISKKSGKKC